MTYKQMIADLKFLHEKLTEIDPIDIENDDILSVSADEIAVSAKIGDIKDHLAGLMLEVNEWQREKEIKELEF
jgi:hypothetical protein